MADISQNGLVITVDVVDDEPVVQPVEVHTPPGDGREARITSFSAAYNGTDVAGVSLYLSANGCEVSPPRPVPALGVHVQLVPDNVWVGIAQGVFAVHVAGAENGDTLDVAGEAEIVEDE